MSIIVIRSKVDFHLDWYRRGDTSCSAAYHAEAALYNSVIHSG
jgi:hypothetical protein